MTVLALPYLFEQVVARFELDTINAHQAFGWREPGRLITTSKRITWVPGDPNGALGEITGAKQPGRNPRPLATLEELCTVEIHAVDPAQPVNDQAQYEATRLLFDDWYRAVYLAMRGRFRIASSAWITPRGEVAHGRCLRIVIAVDAMLPDSARTPAPADAVAVIDVAELNVTETDTFTKDES